MASDKLEADKDASAKAAGTSFGGQVAVGVVTAIVLGALGLLWNWASQGGVVHFLGGVTLQDADGLIAAQIKKLDIKATNFVPKFSVQRFGAKGRAGSIPGDELDYTAANNDTLIASRREFPICYISSVSVGGGTGNCSLIQSPQDDWRIYVAGVFGCKVTCLRVDPGSQ